MDGFLVNSKLNISIQYESEFNQDDYGSTDWSPEDNIKLTNSSDDFETTALVYQIKIEDVLKTIAMILVMFCAVFGNSLVVISVFRFERLRIIANSFIVSLAFADLLVAILVMPFSASQEIAGKWVFGNTMCNIFNANDVLFSTASLLHLCCISMDRYIAILDPFHYETKMTKKRVAIMLCMAWGAASLISHIPIQMGWYTTQAHKLSLEQNSEECTFFVNKYYAAISSSISFWIPATIMIFTYVKIFREARRQEKAIYNLTKQAGASAVRLTDNPVANGTGNNNGLLPHNQNGHKHHTNPRISQDRKKMKREHKAAKTLGIIMGAFMCCWLPFFIWYLVENMCDVCEAPDLLIKFLFWIGYCNSAFNPIIYAFFSRDFRNAFKRLLHLNDVKWSSLCCCTSCSRLSCRHNAERDALARYGAAEMSGRTTVTRADDYNYSTSTPSPRSRKYYDTVDAV